MNNKAIANFVYRIRAARNRMATANSTFVRVGWVDGSKTHKGKDGSDTGFTLASIAKVMCYGRAEMSNARTHRRIPAIPSRNFVEVMKKKYMKPIASEMRKEILDIENVKEEIDYRRIGVTAKGQMQRAVKDSNEYAPNAPSTVRRKGSARPLIDTGILLNSVDFEIVKEK